MDIIVDNLQVLSSGSVVVKKDSEIRFKVDDYHELVMLLKYNDDNNAHIEVEDDDKGGRYFKCFNFGVNDSSRGLKFPVGVMDDADGSHILLQFIIVGVGESRTLHYTWYRDTAVSGNNTIAEEEK